MAKSSLGNIIYERISTRRGLECLMVAIEDDFHKIFRGINRCREYNMFKVNVYVRFLGTPGFSARREGR